MEANGQNEPALRALRQALAPLAVPVTAVPTVFGSVVEVEVEDHVYELVPVWAGEGFPRDVERAVESRGGLGDRHTLVVAARRMSPGAIEWLDQRGLSWADLRGAARIVSPPALAIVTGTDRVRPLGVDTAFSWTPSAGAVAEYVLTAADRAGGLDPLAPHVLPPAVEMAQGLDWSPAQVSNVLRAFDACGWTRKEGALRGPGASRVLTDPSGLLSAWAAWHATRKLDVVAGHARWRDAHAFARSLSRHLPVNTWCFSGWLAAAEQAPFATGVPMIHCYVDPVVYDGMLDDFFARAGIRRVGEGHRLEFVRAERHVLGLREDGGVPLAPPVRVYGDLLRLGGRGEEAAQHLRETRLGC